MFELVGIYLSSRPKGARDRGISFICCFANGIPTIVIASKIAWAKCVTAISHPKKSAQRMLKRINFDSSNSLVGTIVLPNGVIVAMPSFMACTPNGIPMIVRHTTNPPIM